MVRCGSHGTLGGSQITKWGLGVSRYVESWWRLTIAGLISLVVGIAGASPALANGTMTVSLSGGAGNVSGNGIDCSRALDGTISGVCSHRYTAVQVCDPELRPPCHYEG